MAANMLNHPNWVQSVHILSNSKFVFTGFAKIISFNMFDDNDNNIMIIISFNMFNMYPYNLLLECESKVKRIFMNINFTKIIHTFFNENNKFT